MTQEAPFIQRPSACHSCGQGHRVPVLCRATECGAARSSKYVVTAEANCPLRKPGSTSNSLGSRTRRSSVSPSGSPRPSVSGRLRGVLGRDRGSHRCPCHGPRELELLHECQEVTVPSRSLPERPSACPSSARDTLRWCPPVVRRVDHRLCLEVALCLALPMPRVCPAQALGGPANLLHSERAATGSIRRRCSVVQHTAEIDVRPDYLGPHDNGAR